MSKSGILEALRDEEKSLKTQLVAIQRAIEAIRAGRCAAPAARGKKKARKVVVAPAAPPKRKRAMTEEQRQAISERMRKYWRRDGKKKGRGRLKPRGEHPRHSLAAVLLDTAGEGLPSIAR